jgi:hypothetical protein
VRRRDQLSEAPVRARAFRPYGCAPR